jgi:hypothetical protein
METGPIGTTYGEMFSAIGDSGVTSLIAGRSTRRGPFMNIAGQPITSTTSPEKPNR